MRWRPSPAGDLHHYNLYRDPEDPLTGFITDLTDTTYVDNRVAAGETYRYWVTAVDAGLNESVAGDTVSVTVPRPKDE